MNNKIKFNESRCVATDDKVTCEVICGYIMKNIGMTIENVFSMEGSAANVPSNNRTKIRAKIFDEILENLEMAEKHGSMIIESQKELLSMRSDGYYVFLYF